MKMIKLAFMFIIFGLTNGSYINYSGEKSVQNVKEKSTVEWQHIKKTLGLTNDKIELLKSQKDQKATVNMLNKFIHGNPQYRINSVEKEKKPDSFLDVYRSIVKKLKLSTRTLKTSLNFELADKPQKDLRRSRRKIAVRMVSDMPSDKIDDLLKAFNEKYGIDEDETGIHPEHTDTESDTESDDDARGIEPDYMYENLYEDEEDASTKTHENSLQDLILQAKRNQWQRDFEETKLYQHKNEHFI